MKKNCSINKLILISLLYTIKNNAKMFSSKELVYRKTFGYLAAYKLFNFFKVNLQERRNTQLRKSRRNLPTTSLGLAFQPTNFVVSLSNYEIFNRNNLFIL